MSLSDILLALSAVALAWLAGRLATRAGISAVLGELAAGVAMGPSLAPWIAPTLTGRLVGADVGAIIGLAADVAVLLFMCRVGLELDLPSLRREAPRVATIATASLVVPLFLGAALALAIHDDNRGPLSHEPAFVLFVGTAMSVTALPVLTRMLADWRAQHTTIGTLVTACAAVDDVAAWSLLGAVTAWVGAGSAVWGPATVVLYLAAMLAVVKPALAWVQRHLPVRGAAWVCVLALTAAGAILAAERAGLHAVFGAFLFGAVVPRAAAAHVWLDGPVARLTSWLLPAFFVVMGLRTDLSTLGGEGVATLLLVMAVAWVGKAGAGALAARVASFTWREALVIGTLLNTRGLVALVVVDVGRQLGIISPGLFAVFVVMSFVMTAATVPVCRLLKWPSAARGDFS